MALKPVAIVAGSLLLAASLAWGARSADGAEVTGSVTIGCAGWSSTGDLVASVDGPETLDILAWDGTLSPIYADTVDLTAGATVPIGDHVWSSAPTANPIALSIYARSSGGQPWPASGSSFVASWYGSCGSLDWVAPKLQAPGPPLTAPVSSFDIVGNGCAGTDAWLQIVVGGEVASTIAPIAVPSADNVGHLGFGNTWKVSVPVPDGLVLPATITVVAGCGTPSEPLSPTGLLVVQLPGSSTGPVAPPTAEPSFTG